MNYIVDNNNNGLRVDAFLTGVLTNVSRARVQKFIIDGYISVNDNKIFKKNIIVEAGDVVHVGISAGNPLVQSSAPPPQAQNIPLDILYEDEYYAAINKPAGLVVHPGSGNADGTVVNALLHRFGSRVSSGSGVDGNRPGIVHRLDKDTTGALIVAKTDAAHAALAELFSSRTIRKTYTGFCVGARPREHELIDLPLARSRRDPTKRAVVRHQGDKAVTEYHLKAFYCGISLMEFILHTGRTHQIRVHCGHKGFPIVRDDLYGGHQDKILRISPMERPFAYGIFKCFKRQALHARALSFVHPFTNRNVEITAPYPEDFCLALQIFGSPSSSFSALSISSCGSE